MLDVSFFYDLENEDGIFFGMVFNWFCFRVVGKNFVGFNKEDISMIFKNFGNVLDIFFDLVVDGIFLKLLDDIFLLLLENGKVILDLEKLISNEIYYVLLIVYKNY